MRPVFGVHIRNALPDPASLFIILALITLVLSAIFGSMGASAVHPGTGKTIKVLNLMTLDGFRMIWSQAVNNFASFAPLAMVLVCVIGAGLAERSGFLATFMQVALAKPLRLLLPLPLFLLELMAMWPATLLLLSCRL